MNILKKVACIAVAFLMLLVPVCAAHASEEEDAVAGRYLEDEDAAVMPLSMRYMNGLAASIEHDEDTGYFWCSGFSIDYDETNYRMTITLRLMQSTSSTGLWTEMGKWSEYFYLPGSHDTYFIYRGYYALGMYYCTENYTEVYQGKTNTVIETASVKSKALYVNSGRGGI